MNYFDPQYLFYGTSLANNSSGTITLGTPTKVGFVYPSSVGEVPYADRTAASSQIVGFEGLQSSQNVWVDLARTRWSDVSGITWVSANDPAAKAIVSLATFQDLIRPDVEGRSQVPSAVAGIQHLHAAINRAHPSFKLGIQPGFRTFDAFMHEIGHALGLDHTGGSAPLIEINRVRVDFRSSLVAKIQLIARWSFLHDFPRSSTRRSA